jgi:predicted GH43/DUF377 family glycosyl hydrolase/glycosyltransferase involved in cell wall biosynthesis
MTSGGQSVGLCMIVRNEETAVERCLRSVTGLVDSWVVCDTGSRDRTREIVRSALADLPGELHETEWQDFGHNRSELMDLAMGSADYLLIVDADMTVEQRGSLPRLDVDAYTLPDAGGAQSGVLRLVRGDRRWWYEGSTHDCIATDGRITKARLDGLVIRHHRDRPARRFSLIRDVGLLKRDLLQNPHNPRTVFRLAQTYLDLGHHEVALRYFRRRVEMGGWDEESFIAQLHAGALLVVRDRAAAVPILLETWERWPTRAEPLYELARAHRRGGDLALAHMFATRGLEIPSPVEAMHVRRWVYEWGLELERARAAARLGLIEQARADLRALLHKPSLPCEVEEFARGLLGELGDEDGPRSRAPHRDEVKRLDLLARNVRIGELKLRVKPAWPYFNPSIASDAGGYRMIVRSANYQIERGVLHREGIVHNINYLVRLDGQLAVTGTEALVDRSKGPPRYGARIRGYEDCRLIEVGGRWYATATVCDATPFGRPEMVLLHLEGSQIVAVQPLEGPFPGRHEKNWMPFVVDGSLHVLYTCGPTIVMRCDTSAGGVQIVKKSGTSELATKFRGGSQGVRVNDGYLFVVHEVDHSERLIRYLHRFVLLGDDLVLTAISTPFTFTADRIEFCAGMALTEGELILSFGVSDAATGLATVPLDEALALLEPTAAHLTTEPIKLESV